MTFVTRLKHAVIPHAGNHHRPHLIRPVALLLVALAVAGQQFLPIVTAAHQSGVVLAYATDINTIELLKDTNAERTKVGLPALRLDARLNASAADKAQDMVTYDYWAHVSPSGVQPWHWFEVEHYTYSYAGENLAKDFDTSAGVTQGWMNSQTHRDNLLNSHYVDVGFAAVNGTLQGQPTTLVVAHYGTAVASAPPAAPIASTSPKSPTVASAKNAPVPPERTPAVAALPSPAPTSLSSTPVPSASPQTKIESLPQNPPVYTILHPLPVSRTLSPASKLSVIVLLAIGFIMLTTHYTVWRRRIVHGLTHSYKLRVAFELSIISTGIVVVIARSFGAVI